MPTSSSHAAHIEPMTSLQNRWYNGLVADLSLSPETFQLSQPSPPIQASDVGLWAYQNVIPPASLTFNHSACDGDSFFDEYVAAALQMQFPQSVFEEDIGAENYAAWLAYLKQISPPPTPDQLPSVFQAWASVYAPSVVAVGVADLTQMALIDDAARALAPYLAPDPVPVDFAVSYAELLQALNRADGARVSFDSAATSGDVTGTWARGADSGAAGLWAGCCPASRISREFAAGRVTVEAQCRAYLVLTSTPGAWYDSALLHMAYSSPSTPPWPQNPNPSWNQLFGPDGSMRLLLASLLVVDGVEATVTSEVSYSEADRQSIRRNASKGLWPFYAPDGTPVTNSVTFDASGMRAQLSIRPQHPLVIGANILSTGRCLGHGAI